MTLTEQAANQKTGLDGQVVTLYHGARYHLYSYKRYADVRLVMAPEKAVAFFGGDRDNFEYPRFDLDLCFFRIYEHDQPLQCEHYLRWSRNGAGDGELTFVLGHPRRTQRLYTLDELKFLRDVESPSQLTAVCQREVLLSIFAERNTENARIASGASFGSQNRRKSLLGVYGALLDPQLLALKRAEEEKLRTAVAADPQKQAQWGDAWEQIATAQRAFRQFYPRYNALQGARTRLRPAPHRADPGAAGR